MSCIHPRCRHTPRQGRSTFKFPNDVARRNQWLQYCGYKCMPTFNKTPRLCEYHFDSSQFDSCKNRNLQLLIKTAIPTVQLLQENVSLASVKEHQYIHATYDRDHSYCVKKNELPSRNWKGKRFNSEAIESAACMSNAKKKRDDNIDHNEPPMAFTEQEIEVAACCEIPALSSVCSTLQSRTSVCSKCTDGNVTQQQESSSDKITNLQNKVKSLNRTIIMLRNNLRCAKRKRIRQSPQLRKIFSTDQISTLCRSSSRCGTISGETMKNGLEILFACGSGGYTFLRKKGYPLPALRTLRKHMQHVKIDSGILHEVFSWMKTKCQQMNRHERVCCLSIDEMSIKPATEYDLRTCTIEGRANLPNHTGDATHAMVFQLCGLATRWKQVVAYFFTPNAVKGIEMKPIVTAVVTKAAEAGLDVIAVTSDMAACNRAMWSSFDISCHRDTEPNNKAPHPVKPDQFLYFLADAPHLLKNLKQALINGQDIILPQQVVSDNSLPSTTVTVNHLKILNNYQQNSEIKLSHKLNDDILQPNHFNKMKVKNATAIFSHTNASALQYLVQVGGFNSEILTTAWFLGVINKWFDLISSRTQVTVWTEYLQLHK